MMSVTDLTKEIIIEIDKKRGIVYVPTFEVKDGESVAGKPLEIPDQLPSGDAAISGMVNAIATAVIEHITKNLEISATTASLTFTNSLVGTGGGPSPVAVTPGSLVITSLMVPMGGVK